MDGRQLCMLHEEPQRLKVVFGKDDLRPDIVKASQRVA
jgi:hypothetical protein